MRSGGFSSKTMSPAFVDTFKSWKYQPIIANWNYSGSVWVGLGRFGPINSDYKAVSASQQSWSSGLAELGNYFRFFLWRLPKLPQQTFIEHAHLPIKKKILILNIHKLWVMDFYDYTRMSSFKRDKFICCEGLDLNSLDRVKRYLQYFLYGRKLY